MKKHAEEDLNASLLSVLCCRLREGYVVKVSKIVLFLHSIKLSFSKDISTYCLKYCTHCWKSQGIFAAGFLDTLLNLKKKLCFQSCLHNFIEYKILKMYVSVLLVNILEPVHFGNIFLVIVQIGSYSKPKNGGILLFRC